MPAIWVLLMISAFASGAMACTALIARRTLAGLSVVACVLLLGACLYAIGAIVTYTERAAFGLAAAVLGIGAAVGGFWLAATLVPALTRQPSTAGLDPPEDGPPALIVVADGQPEHYHPSTTTQSFERLAGSGVPLPPAAVRAFAYVSDRSRYRAAGISPARPVVRAVTARAITRLRESGFPGEVHEAWLHGSPGVSDAILAAAGAGARSIAMVLYDVAEPYELDLAIRELSSLGSKMGEVTLAQSPPLWTEDVLVDLVCDKVIAALPGGLRDTDGVVIAANGQPPQWDSVYPQATEQRTFFCQRVRATLLDRGLSESRVRSAWLDWHTPDVTEVVRHLAAIGCERMVIVPATAAADTLEIVLDLPSAVEQAGVDESVSVTVLHGWGDEEAVAEVIARVAADALAELDRSPASEDQ